MTRPHWWLGVLDRACRALLWLAPADYRAACGNDTVATFLAVCAAARRERGRWGLVRVGLLEGINIAWSIIRLRTGSAPRITAGPPRRRNPGSEDLGLHRRSGLHLRSGLHPRTGATFMSWLVHDLRLAVRGFAAGRMTTATVVLILALGIGINAAVFSVLDSILWRPVPFAEASRLVTLAMYSEKGKFTFRGRMSARLVSEWKSQTDLFDRVEASESRSYIFEDSRGSDLVTGSIVTPGLLPMLGVRPIAGRLFTDGDGRGGTDRHVIVTERFWRDRLQRDPAAVGRPITLNGARYDVVGIMPATFRFPDDDQEFWIPYDVAQPPPGGGQRESLVPLVRLRPGATRAQVDEQVIARGATLARAAGDNGDFSARVMELGQMFDDRTERSLLVLGGAVLCLLLIVCANVTNLVLSRSLPRVRDAAIRLALGASRRDVMRETLLEHLLLGAVGAVGGVIVAEIAIGATLSMLPLEMTRYTLNTIDLDGRALAFLALIALATVLTCGLPAAFAASRASVSATLQRDSRSSTGSAAARRFRSTLAILEVGLSIVLLVGASLMTRSLMRLQAIDIGLDPANLVTMRLGLPAPGYAPPASRDAFTGDLLDRLRHEPGVIAASAGDIPPRGTMVSFGSVEFGDRPERTDDNTMFAVFGIWPDYFRTAGIRLLQGHEFAAGDSDNPAIVSESFARKYWPTGPALGRRFRVFHAGDGTWRTVVGVASDVRSRSDVRGQGSGAVYYPHDRVTDVARVSVPTSTIAEYRSVVVRARAMAEVTARLPIVVHEADPRVVVSRTTPVERIFADEIARPRIVFLMMSVFAVFGLLLAAAGLYAVLSCLVAQRLREIGIRLALGARPRDVGRLILGSGLRLTSVGLAAGIGLALALVRVMRTLLYEVEPSDPTSVVLVSLLLLAVALAASWIPARRAMRVDPVSLLRE
jgi:predicted permease